MEMVQCATLAAPIALVLDKDNGIIVADRMEAGPQSSPARDGWLDPFEETDLNVQTLAAFAPGGNDFSPVGVALVPGRVLISDVATSRFGRTALGGRVQHRVCTYDVRRWWHEFWGQHTSYQSDLWSQSR